MAQVPYEFLVRWNHMTGAYQGSHVKLYDNVTMREGDAQAVGDGAFPLAEILTAIEQGAIITADNAIAERDAALAQVAAKAAEIAALQAQIAELTAV